MSIAAGYVHNSSGTGIAYATMYDSIDGYWSSDQNGAWATYNGYAGLQLTASAYGYNSETLTCSPQDVQYDPDFGTDVFWLVFTLTPAANTGGTTGDGW